MGLVSNTGLLATPAKNPSRQSIQNSLLQNQLELRCEVTPAPFILRPYAGLYNPFPTACSVLCNHPADSGAKEVVRRAKDGWPPDGKNEDGQDKEKMRTPHDILSEDMFRRYAETDSRPLTPAPTLASGKSRGSRRCLTPDQPYPKTAIVVDLRRSHSQETLYFHGYATSDLTTGLTNDRSTLPSLNMSDATHTRIIKGQPCEQLPPLAAPLVLSKRAERPSKENTSVRNVKKWNSRLSTSASFHSHHNVQNNPANCPKKPILKKSNSRLSTSASYHSRNNDQNSSPMCPRKSALIKKDGNRPHIDRTRKVHFVLTSSLPPNKNPSVITSAQNPKNQLKALNLNKPSKTKSKAAEPPSSQRSKGDKTERETNDDAASDVGLSVDEGGNSERRRGKRRRKGRQSDRLTSAGLAAQAQQDPETQIAGIGTDSHNASSRGSIAQAMVNDVLALPQVRSFPAVKKTDSFLDDDILKYLHREVDEEAIEQEFDVKRRYVLEEALRTRPEKQYGQEMQNLLKDFKFSAVSLGDWLHIPRIFSRKNAQFTLPIDSNELMNISPMEYAARFVTIKKSKQLLYLTVLRKLKPEGYRMPKKDIEEGLILMMGGILTTDHTREFKAIMEWDTYIESDNIPDDIKLTLLNTGKKRQVSCDGDAGEFLISSIKYRTWCGLCAICERMYGRFQPRQKDPPDGMELSDFTMLETRLAVLKVHSGLNQILNAIRTR